MEFVEAPQTWQMLSSYGICSEGQNQVNVRVQLVGSAQGQLSDCSRELRHSLLGSEA